MLVVDLSWRTKIRLQAECSDQGLEFLRDINHKFKDSKPLERRISGLSLWKSTIRMRWTSQVVRVNHKVSFRASQSLCKAFITKYSKKLKVRATTGLGGFKNIIKCQSWIWCTATGHHFPRFRRVRILRHFEMNRMEMCYTGVEVES
jgi:hypothetical protein